MLAAEVGDMATAGQVAGHDTLVPVTWFERHSHVERVPLASLASVDRSLPDGFIGPQELAIGEWIVQLTDEATAKVRRMEDVSRFLQERSVDATFTLIEGLGTEGLVLVRAQGASRADIEASLDSLSEVESFSLNQRIQGQDVVPSDTDFARGAMPSLNLIGMPKAWQESIGSLNTVVGVLDTGIDLAHRDLYLNIWLNQGEIPSRFFAEDGTPLLKDIDGDGLVTFYDLNHATRSSAAPFELTVAGFKNGPNKAFVEELDLNGNGYIDALDILASPLWADGRDTDGNGEVDDFFGLNLRGEGNAPNNPMDTQGHGTHVAGTIGAVGGNASGVTGINWQVSLMPLRILDSSNQGDTGSALRAVNYAKRMRERYRVDDSGRVVEGANVRVLNNSWGQPGGFEQTLETAITEIGEAGILFVAAAGNGNFLGQGVDNDRTPFYPASYNSPNIIAVAASTLDDRLASFSNFGVESVDIAAPGVGIRSTELGGGFGTRNGTSMATPHVTGAAALVWSQLPDATTDEVRKAIISTVDIKAGSPNATGSRGRLNASSAVTANVFAPTVRLERTGPDAVRGITSKGGRTNEFKVTYFHPSGIDIQTVGDGDLIVTRQWGSSEVLVAELGSKTSVGDFVEATYVIQAPGMEWDSLDFGDYTISSQAGSVRSNNGQLIEAQDIGSFSVRIEDDENVLYVDRFDDSLEPGTLRSRIIEANARNQPTTIILESGTYELNIAHQVDTASTFPVAPSNSNPVVNNTGWSNERSGDFDITGAITLIGNQNDFTVVDGNGVDRVFKVHPNATLNLERLTVTGGVSPFDQGGGGLLTAGSLTLKDVIVRGNSAQGKAEIGSIGGGGIAAWGGQLDVMRSWIDGNTGDLGGGVFTVGSAETSISQSTLSHNLGGGMQSQTTGKVVVSNSTFSGNRGGRGAISNRESVNGVSAKPSLNTNGRFLAFESAASNLVSEDTNGVKDVFVYDVVEDVTERISVSDGNLQGNNLSGTPSISGDGRFVAFVSSANNLVADDTNQVSDVFVYDRMQRTIERVSIGSQGGQASSASHSPAISADGRFVAFVSDAIDLVSDDTNEKSDIFVYDRESKEIQRVSVDSTGLQADGHSDAPSISSDGRFVAFESEASDLVSGDTNGSRDIFVFDRLEEVVERVNVTSKGMESSIGRTSRSATISGDGRYVAFQSNASNLVDDNTDNLEDVFVFDRTLKLIERVSTEMLPRSIENSSQDPFISSDGRYVAFEYHSLEFVELDDLDSLPVNYIDIVVFNRVNKQVETISRESFDFAPVISGHGRYLSYQSLRSSMTPVNNPALQLLLFDREDSRELSPNNRSTTLGTQLTVVNTSDSAFSITGRVELKDSLLFNRVLGTDDFVSSENTIDTDSADLAKIDPLIRSGFMPPVHPLLRGSLAIDNGSVEFSGEVDQLGSVRAAPDIGSVEANTASIAGVVFVDLNQNAFRDNNEPLLSDVIVSLESDSEDKGFRNTNQNGQYLFPVLSVGEAIVSINVPPEFSSSVGSIQRIEPSRAPNRGSLQVRSSDEGRFIVLVSDATNLVRGDNNGVRDVFVYDRIDDSVQRVSVSKDGVEGRSGSGFSSNGPSIRLPLPPAISTDGRFVAFESSDSLAGVFSDFEEEIFENVFFFDRQTGEIDQISTVLNDSDIVPTVAGGNGHSFSPLLSADGRLVAFTSFANNLVSGENDDSSDVFVFDRQTRRMELISIDDEVEGALGNSYLEAISADGQTLAILFVEAENDRHSVFVHNREDGTTKLVSVGGDGSKANGDSFSAALSANGGFVAFVSTASNLVSGDNNQLPDVFVHDLQTGLTERVSKNTSGAEANGASLTPSLSADGRFVVFDSRATNLSPVLPNTPTDRREVFVYDRDNDAIAKVSQSATGEQGDGSSFQASVSADRRFVTFASFANNLVPEDRNLFADFFVAPNPFAVAGRPINLLPGDRISTLDFGLIPMDGQISGRLFEDSRIPNANYDVGEDVLVGHLVFLDGNGNGLLDRDERSVLTDAEGIYRFENVPSFRNYTLVVVPPLNFEFVTTDAQAASDFSFFLPARGNLKDIDFGFRPITTTGQSSDSIIRGRVMIDVNRNGIVDEGDVPSVKRVVYMDAGKLGIRDFDDPRAETDKDGFYEFTGLPATVTPLLVLLDETLEQTDPVGNLFDLEKFPLQGIEKREGNPQAVVTGLFNNDTFPDVAVLLAETNALSIRLNDEKGGFSSQKIDISLSDLVSRKIGAQQRFLQPTAIVTGNFDANPAVDIAITGNFSSNVLVLRNFDVANFDPAKDKFGFADAQLIPVGNEPLDIIAGQFGGDAATDLVVLNKGDNQVRVLTNNGSGAFAAGTPIATGGVFPASLAVADFNVDGKQDLAVTHSIISPTNTTAGRVTVLVGDGNGGLALSPSSYTVQAGAVDSAVGDFNGDKRPDLAVVNFRSNSISVLLGKDDGTLQVQATTLGTTQGAVDIAVVDIDNDGDGDILASKLQLREVAIFRNVTPRDPATGIATGEVRFEPQESIGLGRFTFAERSPFVLANLDNDTSGPRGTGTIDIIAVPQNTDTLFVLNNTLVQGARRAAVSGARTDVASGVDFLIQNAALPPSFEFESTPLPIVENSPEQTLKVVNIQKGRPTGLPLRFSVTSSNSELIASPSVTLSDDGTEASVRYTPVRSASGTSKITVRALDAGANGVFEQEGTLIDDVAFERSFTVTVLDVVEPINTSIVLSGEGEAFNMTTTPNVLLSRITSIDIRGTGSNSLLLDLNKVSQITPGRRLVLLADNDDVITFGAGWVVQTPELIDGGYTHVITASTPAAANVVSTAEGEDGAVRVELKNSRPLQNPLQAADADRNGKVQPLDALLIINELQRRGAGPVRIPTTVSEISRLYFDVTGDNSLSAVDALRVINAIARNSRGSGSGEGELFAPPVVPVPVSTSRGSRMAASSGDVGNQTTGPMKLETVVEGSLAKASVNGTGNRVPATAKADTAVERTGEAHGNKKNRELSPVMVDNLFAELGAQ